MRLFAVLCAAATLASAQADRIEGERIRPHVKFLSSDLLEGRGPGARGGLLAQEYIAAQFAAAGLKPAGDAGTFLQKVPLKLVEPDAAREHLSFSSAGGNVELKYLVDFIGTTHQQQPSVDFEAEAVFVGHGIRAPDDPVILNTLKIVDAVLKIDTPAGPSWHRYNHDGYGQQRDGGPFTWYGVGRAWPLLTGERGHYELAAGRSPEAYLRTMERFASDSRLLCEQVWDEADMPETYMRLGEPTGSAMPLMWAHAEYVKLLRSAADGKVFDQVPEVADRYLARAGTHKKMEVWKLNRPVRFMRPGEMLRVIGDGPFRLRWTSDKWASMHESASQSNLLDIDHVDLIDLSTTSGITIEFTFFWIDANRWEGRNYFIAVR